MNRELKNYHPYHGKYTGADEEDPISLGQINVRELTDNRLLFRKIPYVIWSAGIFVLISGFYLIYHLALGHLGVLFKGYRQGHWWQYLIAIAIIFFGLIFMYAGKVESLIFDREIGIMSQVKTSIICKKKQRDWALDQIKNIRVFKRGHDGV